MCSICTAVRNAIHDQPQTAKPINPVHPTILSNEQEQALLTTIMKMPNGIDLHDIVIVMLRTGIRRGELERLKWSDVDLNAGELHVDHRCVPLSNEVTTVLTERAARVCTEYVMGQNPKAAIVKASRNLADAAKRSGLCNLGLHDLRCNFALRCMMSGMSQLTLCTLLGLSTAALKFMGHQTVSSTTRLYSTEQ